MSRIGKQPVSLPENVSARIADRSVSISGPLGSMDVPFPHEIAVQQNEKKLLVSLAHKTKRASALWGLTRALLQNAVVGVSNGFSVRLFLEGIGYRAALEGETLMLSLGFSHPVRVAPPPGIRFAVEKNIITVSGYDRQLVGDTAAKIRAFRKPEPYKGKGIRRENEVVRRKAGKKAATAK